MADTLTPERKRALIGGVMSERTKRKIAAQADKLTASFEIPATSL
jgi:hypothetical protein